MIRIAICDDERVALRWIAERVRTAFEACAGQVQIDSFSSGSELRNRIFNGETYDVIFLDINMPDIDGIFLAQHLRLAAQRSLLVFVSSQEEEVFRSLSASPFRFLRKSRLEEEMEQLSRDAVTALREKEQKNITLKYRLGYVSVNPYKVVYIESSGKQQILHLGDQLLEVMYRMKELEPMFIPFGFVKPHNSFLVNYRFIYSIRQTELELDNHELLPVSKRCLVELKRSYLNLIAEK